MKSDHVPDRRDLLAVGAAAAVAAAVPRALASPAASAVATFKELRRVRTSALDVAYAEMGARSGAPVLLLHGWPYDIHTYVDVALILAGAGYRVIVPYLRGYGGTRFISASAPRNGQQAALAMDAVELIEALDLDDVVIGGCDWGARSADIVAILRPDRIRALVSVSGYLVGSQAAGSKPLAPAAEQLWWYQFYFATERGALGYAANTRDFARLIWRTASPQWRFDEATFERSALAFDNPDHVAVSIHNYRWRLGLVPGETRYDDVERSLAGFPPVRMASVTLEGDANGAPHPRPEDYRARFVGPYEHRQLSGGIGHNLPQEAPAEFARAIMDADRMAGTRKGAAR